MSVTIVASKEKFKGSNKKCPPLEPIDARLALHLLAVFNAGIEPVMATFPTPAHR